MTLLAPTALAALVVPVVIYVIHWLFGSRRRVRVPALFLWADLPQARTGRSRRRIPPFSWLLLLQLLAAALAAVALARPVGPHEPPRHLALVFDASASMQATDVSPTRFEAARARALDRLNALTSLDLVSLVRAGSDEVLGDQHMEHDQLGAVAAGHLGRPFDGLRSRGGLVGCDQDPVHH